MEDSQSKEYMVVFVGELYVTVRAENKEEACEQASILRSEGKGYFKVRDSYVM